MTGSEGVLVNAGEDKPGWISGYLRLSEDVLAKDLKRPGFESLLELFISSELENVSTQPRSTLSSKAPVHMAAVGSPIVAKAAGQSRLGLFAATAAQAISPGKMPVPVPVRNTIQVSQKIETNGWLSPARENIAARPATFPAIESLHEAQRSMTAQPMWCRETAQWSRQACHVVLTGGELRVWVRDRESESPHWAGLIGRLRAYLKTSLGLDLSSLSLNGKTLWVTERG